MKQSSPAGAERQQTQQAQPAADLAHSENALSFIDNRPEALAQRKLRETINASPQMQAQRKMAAMFNNSPRMVAQRKLHALMNSSAKQLRAAPEEELLQGKFAVQRVEDDEPLQGKFAAAQRVDEGELLQSKSGTAQRVEEEEPLQGKFAPDSSVQLKEEYTLKPNNTGLPDNLKNGVESLSGISMDNVRVYYNSPQPAQLNALAYAQGTDIHVAPGQEQHLPHEAWHVVQQVQGRVQPTMQMHESMATNDDSYLEREVNSIGEGMLSGVMQLETKTVVQRVESVFPKPIIEDGNSQYLRTAFTARATLVPIASSAGGEQYKTSELWVSEVKISNDRPPTKFGKGGQRSHTVAWSLLRTAVQGMGGQRLDQLADMLDHLQGELQFPTNANGPREAAEDMVTSLESGLIRLQDTTALKDFATWQLAASELVSTYVHAYQLSDEATYADGLAVGHGEPGNMATLRDAESRAKLGTDLTSRLPDITAAAIALMDVKSRLSDKILGQVYLHWINDLFLSFPILMSRHEADIVAALGLSAQRHAELSAALSSTDPTKPSKQVRDKSAVTSVEASGKPPEVALPSENRATFTANVVAEPNATGTQRDVDLAAKDKGITTLQAKLGLAHYTANQLNIGRLDVADDRPGTRFGALQRSHTVAWTLVRRHLMHFKGKSAVELVNFVLNELSTLKNDIDSPAQNSKIGFDAPAQALARHVSLHAIANDANGLPLFRWQALLSEAVETYVTLYQLSRSATYSKEERPKGHGEATAIATLQAAEQQLTKGGIPDLKQYFVDNQDGILESAAKLVDAAVATSTLKPANWRIAIEHWLHLVKDQFPKVTALPGFAESIEKQISVMEPQEELLAGYKTTGDERDKVLINLYENAKREVKSVPESFLADLYSSVRLSLAKFAPPDYGKWTEVAEGVKLGVSFTRGWWAHISEYGKPPSRGTARDIPGGDAIKKLIDDAGKYFKAVKADRDNLVDFFVTKMGERAVGHQPTVDFIATKLAEIKVAVGKGIDEAVELSAVGTIENYQAWFDLINKIDKSKEVNYTTLIHAITH